MVGFSKYVECLSAGIVFQESTIYVYINRHLKSPLFFGQKYITLDTNDLIIYDTAFRKSNTNPDHCMNSIPLTCLYATRPVQLQSVELKQKADRDNLGSHGSSLNWHMSEPDFTGRRYFKWYHWLANAPFSLACNCTSIHIQDLGSANERPRYKVTTPFIGWAHIQNDPCYSRWQVVNNAVDVWGHISHQMQF